MQRSSDSSFALPLRPAEWVVLGFLAYCLGFAMLHEGLASLLRVELFFSGRAQYIVLALSIVGLVSLARRLAALGGPPPAQRRGFRVALVLAVQPFLLALWATWLDPRWASWSGAASFERMQQLGEAVLWAPGVGAPPLALWCFAALQVHERGELSWSRLAGASLRALGATAREWAPLLVMVHAYPWMAAVIGRPEVDADAALRALDAKLFGGVEPLLAIQRLIIPALSEWLALAYSFFPFMFLVSLSSALWLRGVPALREGVTALSLAMAAAFIGYTLVPAKGPALSMTFEVPLDLYYLQSVKEQLMDRTRITWDCFPSMHTAGALIMSWLCHRHARRVFWITLPVILSTPVACVYLRYHWVVDVLAGAALALAVIRLTPRLVRTRIS